MTKTTPIIDIKTGMGRKFFIYIIYVCIDMKKSCNFAL